MKGVTRLRFVDVGTREGRELTWRRRWRIAALRTCLLGLALSPASARGGVRAFRFQTTSSSTGSKGSKVVASTMATPKGSGHDFHFEEEDDQALPGAPGAHEVEDGSSDDDAKTDTSDEDDEDY